MDSLKLFLFFQIEGVETPFEIPGKTLKVVVSIGINLYPQDSQVPEKVVQQTDSAMYRSKNENLPDHFYQPAT